MNDKLKVYYDAEFTGLHRNTTLISVGLVCEDGHFFYGEFTDYDKTQCDDWIKYNVINNLLFKGSDPWNGNVEDHNFILNGTSDYIAHSLRSWLRWLSKKHDKQIQIYCDCYAYDWMLFNDLVCRDGHALNIPDNIYYIPMDLSTHLQMEGYDPDITREEVVSQDIINEIKSMVPFKKMGDKYKHNSLWDAYVCKSVFDKLTTITDPSMDEFK